MTSVYTELTKEAAKRGGPAALRAFYRRQGLLIGAAVAGVSFAGTQLYSKVRARGSGTTAAPVSGPDSGSGTDAPAPGEGHDA
ncbi:hypothetical protein [Streptomyces sp. NRRL S-1022]|uniref:hypothetical protein n=1 Tax=Streptomyces sp. NRRL S-1022 TaxID=1463880 RepID=UPI00099D7F5B|nr:hypothetical protein [Streptomyces sp. NRRL S-1022]